MIEIKAMFSSQKWKYKENKIEKKNKKKEKIDLKSINYFNILLQTFFIYLTLLYKD